MPDATRQGHVGRDKLGHVIATAGPEALTGKRQQRVAHAIEGGGTEPGGFGTEDARLHVHRQHGPATDGLEQGAGSNELPADHTLITFCDTGPRAAVAASILRAFGYDARPVLDGGMSNWHSAEDGPPSVQT